MKKLDIAITKAQLVSFGVKLKDGRPEVDASIALMTEGGKQITTYSIYTDEWHSDSFELPIEAMPLIGDLARVLEAVAVRHCRDGQLALPAPAKTKTAVLKGFPNIPDGTKVNVIDVGDEPINLDEIPF